MSDIIVVGSLVVDFSVFSNELPHTGETVLGYRFQQSYGGKGGNQAVAASRLGSSVCFVGKVGRDTFGQQYIQFLKEIGIDTALIEQLDDCSSALASIMVNRTGQHQIVVLKEANFRLSAADVARAEPAIASARVLLCQLDLERSVNLAALRLAHERHVFTILNSALPLVSGRSAAEDLLALVRYVDFLCPNEVESAAITHMPLRIDDVSIGDVDAICERTRPLLLWFQEAARNHGNDHLVAIITLGAHGLVFLGASGCVEHVQVERVKAVDTTGAGDAFCGALAFYLSRFSLSDGIGSVVGHREDHLRASSASCGCSASGCGCSSRPALTLRELLRRAAFVATQSVTRTGSQTSPTRAELPDSLFQ